jgi:hypothetical protein
VINDDPSGDVTASDNFSVNVGGGNLLASMGFPATSETGLGAYSLPMKILPVHAYCLANPDGGDPFNFDYVNDHLKDANAILAQASIQLQLKPSDLHLWDPETTIAKAGSSERVHVGGPNGAPGENWGTITAGQDRTVANVYFSGRFEDDQGQPSDSPLGMTAEKQMGNPCYPAVFVFAPWGSVIAHEIGHLLGLTHYDKNRDLWDDDNLMFWGEAKPNPDAVLTQWQINQMRTSPLLRNE